MGHCWRSKDELISNILLWIPSHEQEKVGWPARTYIQQLCADTGYNLEDLPGAMVDRDGWRERVREIRAGSGTWWWWWWYGFKSLFLSNNNNYHLFAQLYDLKDSYLIQISWIQIYCYKYFYLILIIFKHLFDP